MKQVLSIWLPNLAVERWAKGNDCAPDVPVVLTVEGTHGPVIHAVTKAAAERGARARARLTDARALDPALVAVPADPDGDAALVDRKSTRLNSSHPSISYAVFCLKKKNKKPHNNTI